MTKLESRSRIFWKQIEKGVKISDFTIENLPGLLKKQGDAWKQFFDSRQEGRFVIYSADFQAMNALVGYLTENCCGGRACLPTKGAHRETLPRARRRA